MVHELPYKGMIVHVYQDYGSCLLRSYTMHRIILTQPWNYKGGNTSRNHQCSKSNAIYIYTLHWPVAWAWAHAQSERVFCNHSSCTLAEHVLLLYPTSNRPQHHQHWLISILLVALIDHHDQWVHTSYWWHPTATHKCNTYDSYRTSWSDCHD